MVNINCGNCGSTHESVAEVKQCHIVTPPVAEPAFDSFEDAAHESSHETRQTEIRAAETPDEPAPRGPDALGRSALINPGDPAPPGWEEARRVRVLATEPTKGLLDDLHRAWVTRERLVIELDGGTGRADVRTGVRACRGVPRPTFKIGNELGFLNAHFRRDRVAADRGRESPFVANADIAQAEADVVDSGMQRRLNTAGSDDDGGEAVVVGVGLEIGPFEEKLCGSDIPIALHQQLDGRPGGRLELNPQFGGSRRHKDRVAVRAVDNRAVELSVYKRAWGEVDVERLAVRQQRACVCRESRNTT